MKTLKKFTSKLAQHDNDSLLGSQSTAPAHNHDENLDRALSVLISSVEAAEKVLGGIRAPVLYASVESLLTVLKAIKVFPYTLPFV